MRGVVTRLRRDKVREKVLVADWPDPGKPVGSHVRTRTLFPGITNGANGVYDTLRDAPSKLLVTVFDWS